MRGFTLVELLVALVIVGIALTIVVPRLAPDERDVLAREAARLALLFEQARDEAAASGQPIAWSSDDGVQGFWGLGADGQWQPISGGAFRERRLPEGVRVARLSMNGVPVPASTRIVFTPSGIVAPFVLTLELRGTDLAVEGDPLGRIEVRPAAHASAGAAHQPGLSL